MVDENEETEQDRRKKYRKLRAGGKSDSEAMENVWPSTSAGVKFNADAKAKDGEERAAKAKAGAQKEKKEK
ncbi:MAG: hypothetical protein NTX79_02785 [Candidatus Micrarchaeota archaeon]|nr:hypothetical protein [Candidatus Micrarchaeota archaeon]